MIIAALGLLDIVAGVVLMLSGTVNLAGSTLLFYFAAFFLLKALYSILTAIAAGFIFDVLGYFDLAAAAMLLLLVWGTVAGVFFWAGILMALKGIYSFVMGFMVN